MAPFPSPCQKHKKIFFFFLPDIYCGNFIKILEIDLTVFLWPPLGLSPSKVFNPWNCPLWASSSLPNTIQVFLIWHWSYSGFCSQVSALVSYIILLLNVRDSGLPTVFPFLMELKRYWLFSLLAFYLLRQSDNFYMLCTWDWKPEVYECVVVTWMYASVKACTNKYLDLCIVL